LAVFRRSRRGFTLLEITAVVWALGLTLLLGTTILLAALRIEKAAAAAEHRNSLHGIVADHFRADVALAGATPETLHTLKAGPTCLILRLADGTYVVYRAEEGRLERAALATAAATPYWMPLAGDGVTAAFAAAGTDRRVLTLTLQEPDDSGRRKWTTAIAAALGGDLR
jgi:hypothetical protein